MGWERRIKTITMKRRTLLFTVLLSGGLLSWNNASAQSVEFTWPGGKKAAVSMTYDDGILSQLDQAIPDLNEAGFPGTFYLTGMNLVPEYVERWRAAAEEGHELGCHSLFHPCSGSFDWVREEYRTESYTLQRILDEAKVMNQFLYAIDGKGQRSYAYPCYEKEVGGISYVDTLSRSGYFTGARGGFSPVGNTAKNLNLFDIPSLSITDDVPFEEVVDYVQKAIDHGSLAVFCFHGVGGDHIRTSREYHRKIIAYLKEHNQELWVATLTEISSYLGQQETP